MKFVKKIMQAYVGVALVAVAGCSYEAKKEIPVQADLIVMNVLDAPFYQDAHIKGSRHVPFMDIADYVKDFDRKTNIVVYCSNYACSASGSAAHQLLDMGFTNVWAYEGGMAEWYQLQFPVEGSAEKEYLRAENKKVDTDSTTPVISAHDLKKKMEAYNLL